MTGKRVLLVLDNAVDEDQIRPLLPGTPGTLVVITSRRHLGGVEGAGSHFLDVLPLDDAMSLFQRVAAAPRRRTGRAPPRSSTSVAAYRWPSASRPPGSGTVRAGPVADLADRLRDQRRRTRFLAMGDRTVAAVLGLSYRYLRPDLQRLFRMLSVPPGADFEAPGRGDGRHPGGRGRAGARRTRRGQPRLPALGRALPAARPGPRLRAGALEQHDTPADLRLATQRLLDYYLHLAWAACRPMARGPYRFEPSASPSSRPVSRRCGRGGGDERAEGRARQPGRGRPPRGGASDGSTTPGRCRVRCSRS